MKEKGLDSNMINVSIALDREVKGTQYNRDKRVWIRTYHTLSTRSRYTTWRQRRVGWRLSSISVFRVSMVLCEG